MRTLICSAFTIGLVLVSLPAESLAQGRTPGGGLTGRAADNSFQAEPSAGWQSLTLTYLDKVDALEIAERRADIVRFKTRIEGLQKAAESLAGREADALRDLDGSASRSVTKSLSFAPGSIETHYLNATSDSSAKIFAAAYAKHIADGGVILREILREDAPLSAAWLKFTQRIEQAEPQNNGVQVACAKLLCRAGVLRKEHLPLVWKAALLGDDDQAADILFFSIDPQTGQRVRILSVNNLGLLTARRDSTNPAMRLACARYAIAVNEYYQAENICEHIVNPEDAVRETFMSASPSTVAAWSAARVAALRLLFYHVKSQYAFTVVGMVAAVVEARTPEEMKKVLPPGKAWAPFEMHRYGPEVIGEAESLVKSIVDLHDGGHGGTSRQ